MRNTGIPENPMFFSQLHAKIPNILSNKRLFLLRLLLLRILFWLNLLLSSSVVLVILQPVVLNGIFCIANLNIHFYKNLLYGQITAWYKKSRSSHRRSPATIAVLKYFANFPGKHLHWGIFLSLEHFY